MSENRKNRITLSAFGLHLIAMVCMLCDHLFAVSALASEMFAWIGRIAFPIFAFLLAEGYFRTRDVKRYALRLVILALVSEIPFDLLYGGVWMYPFHQNTVWTLLLGLLCIHANASAKGTGNRLLRVVAALGTVLVGYIIGMVTMVDYYGVGVLTVLVFYFFRGQEWYHFLLQLAAMLLLHGELLGGLSYTIELFDRSFEVTRQAFAVCALLPIWLYRGRQGPHGRMVRWLYYAFYPIHLLLLYLWMLLL